uniref:Pectinesterase inhibitor domain-containing protein n=1 Tax=Oryza punctata TaxID=4537 RepID=A0A0E0K0Q6_ORYPU
MAQCVSRRPDAAAAVVVAVVLAVSVGVGATPETACRAAAEEDRRVDYEFCVSRLSHHHDSPDADTWGLAKVAADVGVCIAGDAAYDAKAMLAKAGGGEREALLERCAELYDRMGSAFAAAYDDINRREYAAGKEKAGEAASLARRCDGAFAEAGVAPSPLERQTAESVKIAIVCTAITSLVNMMMMMKPYTAALLAVAVLGVVVVDATVVMTCRAAADGDGRVDYDFCVAELGKHHDSPSADAWGLAKVAALTGVVDADNAAYDARDLLAKGGGAAADGEALARCGELYGAAGFAFAEAHDDINARDYAAGKGKAADAASLARQCDAAFAGKDAAGAVPPVIAQHSSYAARMAIICTAITNLIE